MAKAYSDVGIKLYVAAENATSFGTDPLIEIKSTPATGQAGGTLEVTTHTDTTKVYIPDRPDTGDMDYTYNYTADNLTAVKTICDSATHQFLIVYPDGAGSLYKGQAQTWKNEVSVGGIIECTLHTVPSSSPEDKTATEVSALLK